MLNRTKSANEHPRTKQHTPNAHLQTLRHKSGEGIRAKITIEGKKLRPLRSENGKYLRQDDSVVNYERLVNLMPT